MAGLDPAIGNEGTEEDLLTLLFAALNAALGSAAANAISGRAFVVP